MQTIILAAGIGSRLGSALPKPLTQIAPGLTLLGNLVAILARLAPLRNLHVVVGHQAAAIVQAFPHLHFVLNAEHASTNTARSLLLGLRAVSGDEDVLWINGDLYLQFSAAQKLLRSNNEHSRALVDAGRAGPEAMKYSLCDDGTIAELSKSVTKPRGESLGMHLVVKRDRPALHEALLQARPDDFYEAALERCSLAGTIRVMPIKVDQEFCREVDDAADLEAVRLHIAGEIRGEVRGPGQ